MAVSIILIAVSGRPIDIDGREKHSVTVFVSSLRQDGLEAKRCGGDACAGQSSKNVHT